MRPRIYFKGNATLRSPKCHLKNTKVLDLRKCENVNNNFVDFERLSGVLFGAPSSNMISFPRSLVKLMNKGSLVDVNIEEPHTFINVTSIDASGLELSSIPEPLQKLWKKGKLPSLERLDVSQNSLVHIEDIVESVPRNIEMVDFSGNNIKSLTPLLFSTTLFPKLVHVNVSKNSLQWLPADFGNWIDSGRQISVSKNPIEGIFFIQCKSYVHDHSMFPDLRVLEYNTCDVNKDFPVDILKLKKLEKIFIVNSEKFGIDLRPIPSQVGLLTSLVELSLWKQNLNGTIPTEIGQLTKLTSLLLRNNEFDSKLPSELGRLTSLKKLAVEFNRHVTGTIPTELCKLTALRELTLHATSLHGNLPSCSSNLTRLSFLRIAKRINVAPSLNNWTETIDFRKL